MKNNKLSKQKIGYALFIAFCFALCFVPLIGMMMGYEGKNLENRPLATMPKLVEDGSINLEFPGKLSEWFDDHFGYREELVTLFHGTTIALAKDTIADNVDVGKDGMLFFTPAQNDYLRINLMTDDEIARAATSLRLQKEYVESLGASFVFTVAPNKSSVYPEYMHDYLNPTSKPNNRDMLEEALSLADVPYIDLQGRLMSAKAPDTLLYHLEDTHWNDIGALVGYRAIMESVKPSSFNAYDDATFDYVSDYGGDLHNFVSPAVEGSNARPVFSIERVYETENQGPGRSFYVYTTRDTNDDYLYMYRDSFADALIPYLSANMGRATYDTEFPYNYSSLQSDTPNAVVIELVERNIPNLIVKAPNLPAIPTEVDGNTIGETHAILTTTAYNGRTQLLGAFERGAYAATTDRVLISITSSDGSFIETYEAFPILDERVQAETSSMLDPVGISITLPDMPVGDYSAIVLIETAQGVYEADGATSFSVG